MGRSIRIIRFAFSEATCVRSVSLMRALRMNWILYCTQLATSERLK
jgi:hypothetical protein